MIKNFKAWMVDAKHADHEPRFQQKEIAIDDLPVGDVLVKVEYSSVNYKDALAVTGAGSVLRKEQLIPGVDLSGIVAESKSPDFKEGDKIVATGWGIGEQRHGGYAEYCRLDANMVTKLPSNLSSETAMSIGTAGITALFSIIELEKNNCLGKDKEILVTSSSGGVGGTAIAFLAEMKNNPTAVTQQKNVDYVSTLGANKVIIREQFIESPKALDDMLWDGAIDAAGGTLLQVLLSQMKYGSTVACCGISAGASFTATVMPLILRAVHISGIDSVQASLELRKQAWDKASELQNAMKKVSIEIVKFEDVEKAASNLLAAKVRGRLIIKVS